MLPSHLVFERISTLKISDVMTKVVVTARVDEHLDEVAQRFVQRHLSSAPVVDDKGCCVGILSAADFVRRDVIGSHGDGDGKGLADVVREHMTPTVQAISPDHSLLSAARIMCARHIHHLPVVDAQNHPIGVVSTMDIVAAVVNSVEEMETM